MTPIDILLLTGISICLYISYRQGRRIFRPSRLHREEALDKERYSSNSLLIRQPVINIIFSTETDENEIAEELADLFLKGRTFYYNGQDLPETKLSEKETGTEEDEIIKYETVNWETLTTIEI